MASQAVSFPFTDRAERLRQWFGLKLVWPEDAPFPERKLWSTRRMRSDDLERWVTFAAIRDLVLSRLISFGRSWQTERDPQFWKGQARAE